MTYELRGILFVLERSWFQKYCARNVRSMTTTNYLDLDINKLFEQHTIKEIEEIQKKIQLESDRKKLELRTLVG